MFENIKEDKHKHMRRSRQNDKIKQCVKHRAVKDEVLGSILGTTKTKKFFSTFNCLCYADHAIQSVSLSIRLQLTAETNLIKVRPMKLL